jgi:hypothetical protein
MKMYGIAYVAGFPAICLGTKAWYFKLIWSPAHKSIKFLNHWSDIKRLWWQRVNSYPFKFYGVFILPNEDIYDLD